MTTTYASRPTQASTPGVTELVRVAVICALVIAECAAISAARWSLSVSTFTDTTPQRRPSYTIFVGCAVALALVAALIWRTLRRAEAAGLVAVHATAVSMGVLGWFLTLLLVPVAVALLVGPRDTWSLTLPW